MKQIVSALAAQGMTIRRTSHGEWRVNFREGGTEATAYYTDDPHDALNTGLVMAKDRTGILAWEAAAEVVHL